MNIESMYLMRVFLFLFSFVFPVRVCILDWVDWDGWVRVERVGQS